VNIVAEVATGLSADDLLLNLHAIEDLFGRVRTVPNAPRLIDLDLLDYRGEIAAPADGKATLPHPRMADRAFVLRPLFDLAPEWRHPTSGVPIKDLLAALPPEQEAYRF
jgi:2-amino-4-hydroxy-6-hydroxymethyldihydropteridine diphosphokinase